MMPPCANQIKGAEHGDMGHLIFTPRGAAILGLSAAISFAALAGIANAEPPDRDRHDRRDHRVERRQNGGYWRGGVYYPPPPVVYQPYGVYDSRPGVSLNLTFPLIIR